MTDDAKKPTKYFIRFSKEEDFDKIAEGEKKWVPLGSAPQKTKLDQADDSLKKEAARVSAIELEMRHKTPPSNKYGA